MTDKQLRALPEYKILLELVDQAGQREQLFVQLVDDRYADLSRGFMGEGTPLGQAIINQPLGAEIAYVVDDLRSIKILAIEPTDDCPDPNAPEKNRAAMEKALETVQLTNAVIFASSFTGKWGDYDPSTQLKKLEENNQADVKTRTT